MRLNLLTGLVLLLSAQTFAQNRTVHGTVRDAITAEPLTGVVVSVPNTNYGASTDVEGKYELQVPEQSKSLKFSYLGYQDTLLVLTEGVTTADMLLNITAVSLNDVVITGYTTQNRNQVTGAISTLSGAAVSTAPVASLDQALQGRVPGLYVASASGLPGTPGRVTIRGIGSLQGANTQPLYIVDGIPIESASFAALNPEDFESYNVLKDAAATAQYGSRAANGVIVITTKKGQSYEDGKPRIQYSNQFGVSKVNMGKWDMMNSAQRLQFEENIQDPAFPGWQYSRKNNLNPDGSPKTEADYAFGEHYLDSLRKVDNGLRNKLLRAALTQSHNLSVSGHANKTAYYLSSGYFQQDGVLRNSGLKRYSLRSNILQQSGRWKLGLNIGLSYTDSKITEGDFDVSETNPIAAMYLALPYEQLYNADGSLATGTNKYGANALSMFRDISRKQYQLKSIISANISYQLTNNLKFTGTTGMDFQQLRNTLYIQPDSYLGSLVDPGGQGTYQDQYINKTSMIATGGLTYQKTWNRQELTANLLLEGNFSKLNSAGFAGYGLVPGLVNTPGGITPGTQENNFIPGINGEKSQSALLSQIGLVQYTYHEKYALNASLRRDGSSRVPEANRYKMFYAIGGSWDLKKEGFMRQLSMISTLRVRASYGRTGNAAGFASDFGYRGLYGMGSYGGYQALIPVYPQNPNYNWEINNIGDLGIDFALMENRLRGGFDIYNRVTSSLFIQKRLSYTSGFESIADNAGKISNKGVELYLEGDLIRNKDLCISAGVNFAYNRNRILGLGGADELITDDYAINKVGMPLGQFYMVRWAGVDPQTGAPQYLDAAGNITHTFNPDNAVPVKGSYDPPIKGGFTINIRYKHLELSTLFTFIKGMYRLNTAELFKTAADPNYRQYNQSVSMLNMWQSPGDISDNPGAAYPRYMTDRELQSADYVKLRSIRLSYTLPEIKKLKNHIRDVRVFVQGQNLFTWTRFKAFDPEDDNNWYQYEYPLPRTITAGFNVSF